MKIEKLMNSNHHAWKQRLLLILTLQDLDGYIEYGTPPEGDVSDEKWICGDIKAQNVFELSLSDDNLKHGREI